MCYIIFCTVILLNLSASTICVLVMGKEEESPVEQFIKDNARVTKINEEPSFRVESEDVENQLIAKVKGTNNNNSSFISGSTQATFLTKSQQA